MTSLCGKQMVATGMGPILNDGRSSPAPNQTTKSEKKQSIAHIHDVPLVPTDSDTTRDRPIHFTLTRVAVR
jgi:hypothetical protein